MYPNSKDRIIIIDFGSQVTKLIARRVRELGVFSEILNLEDFNKIKIIINKRNNFIWWPSTVTKKIFPPYQKKYF